MPPGAAHAVSDLYLGGRGQRVARGPAPRRKTAARSSALTRDAVLSSRPLPISRPSPAHMVSDEIETTLCRWRSADGALVVLRRPEFTVIPLRPHSRDRFDAGGGIGLVTFHRTNGSVTGLGVTQDRVWDLRFAKK